MNNSFINLSIRTDVKANCSVYNPCGSHGYCDDSSDDEVTCSCKFWWKGTYCDTLSSSGKQVIVLGVLTGLLVIFYYSLNFFYWITKKRKEFITHKQISVTPIIKRQVSTRTITTNPSRSSLPWITGIFTFIVGFGALTLKWIIFKNIHEEIVYKYQHNQSLYYTRPSACSKIYIKGFNMITFPIACFLILLFIVITIRKSSSWKLHHFIPIPLDFFSTRNRTFAAITFAIVADELSNIANQFISDSSSLVGEGIIMTYLLQIIRVLIIGFHCYPILNAVYLNTRFTLICATVYAWLDFSLIIAFHGVCQNDYYPTNDNYNKTEGNVIFYLDYYGTGSRLIFFQLLTDIPRYFFLAYVCIQLSVLTFKQVQRRKSLNNTLTREQKNLLYSALPDSVDAKYVRNLFGFSQTTSNHRIIRWFQWIYTWRDDFRFSSRVISVYASILFLLFFITVQAYVQVIPYLGEIMKPEPVLMKVHVGATSSSFPVPNLVRPYMIGIFAALIITTTQLFVLLTTIRRNLLQVYRGDYTEIPRRNRLEYVSYACENMHFAGYLIAYVLWGYILIAFFFVLISFLLDIVITYGLIQIMESILKIIIPPILFGICQNYLNEILGRYVFLQHGGEVLSINHRRVMMIFLYFNFFLDAFLGLISSIMRLLKSIIGGIIYMCRLDYSPMGRKLERFDAGFSAYCAFIHMECAHRHPVLLYFTSLLLHERLYRTTAFSKAKRKWFLAVFLLKNPTLIYRRKAVFQRTQINETKMILIGKNNMKTMTIEDSSTNEGL